MGSSCIGRSVAPPSLDFTRAMGPAGRCCGGGQPWTMPEQRARRNGNSRAPCRRRRGAAQPPRAAHVNQGGVGERARSVRRDMALVGWYRGLARFLGDWWGFGARQLWWDAGRCLPPYIVYLQKGSSQKGTSLALLTLHFKMALTLWRALASNPRTSPAHAKRAPVGLRGTRRSARGVCAK
jgi:hypothetical protein